jgi:hypothetical protein
MHREEGVSMTEPNNRELNDKISDIREWLVRIDTKVDFFNDVKYMAERAEKKADEALLKAEDNAEDIEKLTLNVESGFAGIKKVAMWAIGLAISIAIGLAGLIISLF